jgi:hypothetical protein
MAAVENFSQSLNAVRFSDKINYGQQRTLASHCCDPAFDDTSNHVGFVMDEMIAGKVLFEYFGVPSQCSLQHPLLPPSPGRRRHATSIRPTSPENQDGKDKLEYSWVCEGHCST